MKSCKINRLVIIAILLFLASSAYATTSISMRSSRMLFIYVDEESRIYWNIGNPADSLPYLLPSDSNIPDSLNYKIDMRGLYDLLLEKNRAVKRLNNIILIHPKAHYSSLDRILTAIHWVEWVWNDKTAYDLRISANELDREDKFSYRYAIGYWEKRNDRILEAVWKQRNITPSAQTKIPPDQTFAFKFDIGYWDDKITDEQIFARPMIAKPKVGIPKPVADDDVIDENVKIASRENLAGIISHDKEETTAVSKTEVKIDVVKMLPSPDEFVPVDIPAEQIYYHEPEYPRLARTANMEAIVWVKALVDNEGKVRDAMILKLSGSKAGFDESAIQAAYKCRYKPAIQNRRPVAVWISYEVKFIISLDSEKHGK